MRDRHRDGLIALCHLQRRRQTLVTLLPVRCDEANDIRPANPRGETALTVVEQLSTPNASIAKTRSGELAAARDARVTFTHGDLVGDNIRVNPGTGELAGVLDWDGAGRPGDPAVDLAALRASLPATVWDLLLARLRPAPPVLGRAAAYAATFALQEALLGVEQGDEQAIQSGLSAYQRRGEPARRRPFW
jgi:aminoglycoside phosphotransferase (APT) family kinase protein